VPSIDIAIVNYRGVDDTLAALARLGNWPHGVVWVVDNSAHEADQALPAQRLREAVALRAGTRLLVPDGNVGFAQACNLAFARSTSANFLLLNPDARIAVDDVLRLDQTLQQQPQVAAVSPRIYWNQELSFLLPSAFPQTPAASLAMALATRSATVSRWAAQRYVQRMCQRMQSAAPFDVDVVAGSVLLLRRDAVLAAGGLFDPDYFMFFEDADLSLRLRRSGQRLAVDPGASAVHEYRHKAFKEALMAQSQLLYLRKRHPVFNRLSNQLRRVQALSRPIPAERWFRLLPKPTPDLPAFLAQTREAGVVAFSPSQLMMPAIFRPDLHAAQPFSQSEWDLLEPGAYVAWLKQPQPSSQAAWTLFQR
jgi:GT2 family glycosyltransferase